MAQDALTRIRKLDEERAQLLDNAKEEAMGRVREALAQLNDLGFSFTITQTEPRRGRSSRAGTRTVKAAPCPICGFETDPPHDARKHRGQGDRKRPFTAKQLDEMGLTVVG